jgi:tetratricopeptide (TPR) repeat protein
MKLRYLFCFGILEICLMLSGAMAFVNASSDPIFAADELYAKRSNPENVRQAMNLLKQAVTLTPDNSEALWRLAKYQWFLGNQCTHKKTKLTFFSQGQEYARKAVKANCNDINAHFWLAALIGASGQATGNLQSLSSVAPMKKEIDICFQINPEFADAHDMLAQLYWMAPGPPLSIGNKKRALEESQLAVTYSPNNIIFWFNLGQIARDNKDYVKAREAFQKVLQLPDNPEEPEKSREHKANATMELKKLEGKEMTYNQVIITPAKDVNS